MITWKDLPAETLLKVINLCDGHSIFRTETFVKMGVPDALIAEYVRDHQSNTNDFKSIIFDSNGKVLPILSGIYGLTVLEAINYDLGLAGSSKMGRGSRANECREQIYQFLNG
jgi:hypothetical protein